MMKKIFLALLILLLVSGCITVKLPFSQPDDNTNGEITLSFKGGSQSLEISLLNPSSGQTIYSDYPLAVTIQVEDKGDSASEGTLCVTGLNQEKFFGASGCDCDTFSVQVADPNGDNYQKARVTLPEYALSADLTGEYPITLITNYKYNTLGLVKACIKKDPYSDSGCQVKTGRGTPINKLEKSSSGPIQIESVEETITPSGSESSDLLFKVKIKKQSEGKLLGREGYAAQNCDPTINDPKIYVRLLNLPVRDVVNCNPVTPNLKGEAETLCEAKNVPLVDNAGNYLYKDYEPQIIVELEYSYQTIMSSKFRVTKK